MRTCEDMLAVRWRAGQVFVALAEGDLTRAAGTMAAATRVEGMKRADLLDEFRLLRHQFGHYSTPFHLAAEVDRLAWRLGVRRRSL